MVFTVFDKREVHQDKKEHAILLACDEVETIMVKETVGYQVNKLKGDGKEFMQYGTLKDKEIIQPNLRCTVIVFNDNFEEIHLFLNDEIMYYITESDFTLEDGLI